VSLLAAPLWLQLALVAEGLAVAWLTARSGWRGLAAGGLATAAFWFVLALAASFLVGRLEGGRAAEASGVLHGAALGAGRLAGAAWPLLLAAAGAGGAARWALARARRR
jgi:hypothetical protein